MFIIASVSICRASCFNLSFRGLQGKRPFRFREKGSSDDPLSSTQTNPLTATASSLLDNHLPDSGKEEIYFSVVFALRIVMLLRAGAQLRPNALDSAHHQQHNIALRNIDQPFNPDLE